MNRLSFHAAILSLFIAPSAFAADITVDLSAGAVFKDCTDCPEMVVIPSGTFVMGFDGGINEVRYDGPPHEVKIENDFAAGKFEVTTAQFRTFVDATGYEAGTDCRMGKDGGWPKIPGMDWRAPGYDRPPLDDDPVACVSWLDAKAYVAWLSEKTDQPYRLLTESEWEYAARAGTTSTFTWGEDPNAGCDVANYYDQSGAALGRAVEPVTCDDGYMLVSPVGSYEPNAFGLYDMIGNVWEWLEDCYIVPYGVQPIDGSAHQVEGACAQRAVRGGAWHSPATWQRVSFRGRDAEDLVTQGFGFRIARDLP